MTVGKLVTDSESIFHDDEKKKRVYYHLMGGWLADRVTLSDGKTVSDKMVES